jgi:hypothetical protein
MINNILGEVVPTLDDIEPIDPACGCGCECQSGRDARISAGAGAASVSK